MFTKALIFVLIGLVFAAELRSNEELINELKALHESKNADIADGKLHIKRKIAKYESSNVDAVGSEERKNNQKHSDLTTLKNQYKDLQSQYSNNFDIKINTWEKKLEENKNNPKLARLQKQCESDVKKYMENMNARFEGMVRTADAIDES